MITNGYTDLTELTARLDIADTEDNPILEAVIEAASRAVDGWCGRVFYTVTEARVFTAEHRDVLSVPDLVAVTALDVDGTGDRTYTTELDPTDYDLEPLSGPPYTSVWVAPNGQHGFPLVRRGVRITGTWGYGVSVPTAIQEATLLQAARLYKRKDAPFGVAGSVELGQLQTITGIDPDVKQLVAPYRRQALEAI